MIILLALKTWRIKENGRAKLNNVESEKYLGDILCFEGKNKKNILFRRNKGIGIVKQIMTMLETTCFGPHVFEVSLLFRKSFLINSILTNSESWYGIKNEELELLEQVDEMLLRKILEVGKSCPKEMLYLETGSWPIRFIIMSRRLMFLHYVLNEDSKSLIYKFLQAQINDPVKNDWIHTVKEDLEELEIGLDFETIKELSKKSFKIFVDKQLEARALDYLNEIKAKHSKVNHIIHNNLRMQNYLEASKQFNTKLSKFIFHARSRMLDVKENYRNKYVTSKTLRNCPLNCLELDTQEHLLWCDKITSEGIISHIYQPKYEDLFEEDCEKQRKISLILMEKLARRKKLIEKNEERPR